MPLGGVEEESGRGEKSALPHLVLPAAGLAKVRDGGELGVDGLPAEPTIVHALLALLRVLLLPELQGSSEGIEVKKTPE